MYNTCADMKMVRTDSRDCERPCEAGQAGVSIKRMDGILFGVTQLGTHREERIEKKIHRSKNDVKSTAAGKRRGAGGKQTGKAKERAGRG